MKKHISKCMVNNRPEIPQTCIIFISNFNSICLVFQNILVRYIILYSLAVGSCRMQDVFPSVWFENTGKTPFFCFHSPNHEVQLYQFRFKALVNFKIFCWYQVTHPFFMPACRDKLLFSCGLRCDIMLWSLHNAAKTCIWREIYSIIYHHIYHKGISC